MLLNCWIVRDIPLAATMPGMSNLPEMAANTRIREFYGFR
jgi:hypothetical protein